jgi:alkanesulfonate monooxygenase SsuD/methylene tetrahydromethanopterin reductase-like flavin-dependent oxidoreductase (luciferase family)
VDRFGIVVPQDAPFDELRRRWRLVEDAGFDLLYLPDTSRDWRDPRGNWFDCWTVLPALAEATDRIRIGTLVTHQILRPPAMLARAAATVDHLSCGRLELGIGTGIAAFDHDATGTPYWTVGERVRRFREHVEVVDGLLRSVDGPFGFDGEHHRTAGLSLQPAPVQRPRPPITIGGKAPTVRRVAVADLADPRLPDHGGKSVLGLIEEVLRVDQEESPILDPLDQVTGNNCLPSARGDAHHTTA